MAAESRFEASSLPHGPVRKLTISVTGWQVLQPSSFEQLRAEAPRPFFRKLQMRHKSSPRPMGRAQSVSIRPAVFALPRN